MLLTEGQISIEDARLAAGVSRGGRDEADIIVLAGCVLLMQHKLAVAYWSLPLLLPSVGRDMMALAAVPNWWSDPASADRMLRLSRAMLLVVADNATAWNHRKRAIQHSGHCRLDELTFVNLVQSKHQKSQETWAHRRWLIAPLLVDGSAACACPHHKERRKVSTELSPTTPSPQEIWEQELAATERAAILYRKNYNAWTHRMFVASHMPPVQLPELIKRARKHSRMNVSDHAAHHFRCVIIQQHAHNLLRKGGLGSEQDAQLMVSQEQAVTEELIVTFPGHQSLWLSLRCRACNTHTHRHGHTLRQILTA
jgi:protein prenyltransferase alpha subunit repeat containing protein 1